MATSSLNIPVEEPSSELLLNDLLDAFDNLYGEAKALKNDRLTGALERVEHCVKRYNKAREREDGKTNTTD